ncbi:Ig-like domain-containing protein [Bradyrhizobium prioriisuperbiae]|uniref:Ig-like domain-containing protein n=1 Tax=Bradyrhizobium prioriisuperbiae TaxID=2854389 RepID=UPI0028E900FB|nr:Ig-like domain-containing protein [Bradyrhizobium prioritasuperba]
MSHVSFHLKSAAFAVFCIVVLIVLVWVNAARAQSEIISVTTTTSITTSVNPVAPDSVVTLTARVEADHGGVPGGSIDFFDESTMVWLGRAEVASPSITVANLSPGAHPIRAHYSGATAFLPFIAMPSSSAILIQHVRTVPRLELSTSYNPSTPGEPLTLVARVSAGLPKPTGTVTFRDGERILAAGIRLGHDGRAAFITSALSGGMHLLSAEYEGDLAFAKVIATVRQDVGEGPVESFKVGRVQD